MRLAFVVPACLLSLAAQGQSPSLASQAGEAFAPSASAHSVAPVTLAVATPVSLPEFTHAPAAVADLVCPPAKPRAGARPSGASTPAATLVWPDTEDVAAALREAPAGEAPVAPRQGAALSPARPGWRIAVWGDSHMAAGFFTDEIARLLQAAGAHPIAGFLSAGLGHPGVRQPVRRVCLTGDWTREHAHAHPAAAQAPAPGLSALVARQAGAALGLDLRDAQGEARSRQWDVLYDGASAGGTTLGIRIDGGPEAVLPLKAVDGPARLPLRAAAPISTITVRVIEGTWRLQGLQRADDAAAPPPAALLLDQFGFPGATVAGWARADLGYLGAWFRQQRYDLVVLAFGTNEANDPNFQEAAYRQMLARAVGQWRQLQPQAQCVLLAPGDRGVRVARAAARTGKRPAARAGKGKTAAPAPKVDLLRYARLHAQVARIQAEVAASAGCAAWSMQAAMGGMGSAYRWARQQPPLMAPDLIHFTRAGYRELAAAFVADTGLQPR